jgi:hypothetical protein
MMSALIIAAIPSCKKGEDDPFISFQSRKARVAGEWKFTSGHGTKTETGPGADSESWTLDGTSYTHTDSTGTTAARRVVAYTFEKDGAFSFTDTYDGDVYSGKGNWDFEGGVGDVKKRSRIMLFYEQLGIPSYGTFFFDSNVIDESWDLKELRSKHMVWSHTVTYTHADGLSGTLEEEMVFEPK